jgi:hypothetical protein
MVGLLMVLWIGGVLLLIHERKRLGIKDNGLGVVKKLISKY